MSLDVNRDIVKFSAIAGVLFLAGCSESTTDVSPAEIVQPVTETPTLPVEAIRKPLNCPVMITSQSYLSKRENEQFLGLTLQANPDFDVSRGDECQGDIKNLWPDLMRHEDDIEAHLPNVRGGLNTHVIVDNFPETERELKRFVDEASKAQGLPDQLNRIDRSTLEGGMDYNGKIIRLIIAQEEKYWQTVHAPILDNLFSKYGKIRFWNGSEKHAFCYHPHNTCRGYSRYSRKGKETSETRPETRIGVESDYDLEYLWAGIGSYGFKLIEFDDNENK